MSQPKDTGRTSATNGSKAAQSDWKAAAKRATEPREPGAPKGEWVPVRAIWVDQTILPREKLSENTVQHYRDILDQLPPLKVQRDSFRLLDGQHRLEAHSQSGRNLVRIEEIDVVDERAWEIAAELNQTHGLPLSQAERTALGKAYLEAHPTLPAAEVARWAHVDWHTVAEWKKASEGKATRAQQRQAEREAEKARLAAAEREAAEAQAERDRLAAELRTQAEDARVAAAEAAVARAAEAPDPRSAADGGFPERPPANPNGTAATAGLAGNTNGHQNGQPVPKPQTGKSNGRQQQPTPIRSGVEEAEPASAVELLDVLLSFMDHEPQGEAIAALLFEDASEGGEGAAYRDWPRRLRQASYWLQDMATEFDRLLGETSAEQPEPVGVAE